MANDKHTKLAEKKITRVLGHTRPAEAQAALEAVAKKKQEESEAVAAQIAATGKPNPGQTVDGVKTPWTRSDMDRVYGVVTFTPEVTMPVTPHGIRFQLLAGIEMSVPKIVMDVYLDSRRKKVVRGNKISTSQGDITVEHGAGTAGLVGVEAKPE